MEPLPAFPTDYEYELLQELPQPERTAHLYFGGRDGPMVRVRSKSGRTWIETFANGTLSPHGVTGVFPMPDPGRLCVVARGDGYMVPVDNPERYEEVRVLPILDVRSLPQHGVVIFADYTDLLAYDRHGVRWRTNRIAWDGLRITDISGNTITGEYDDFAREGVTQFSVDVRTGACQGGVEGD